MNKSLSFNIECIFNLGDVTASRSSEVVNVEVFEKKNRIYFVLVAYIESHSTFHVTLRQCYSFDHQSFKVVSTPVNELGLFLKDWVTGLTEENNETNSSVALGSRNALPFIR